MFFSFYKICLGAVFLHLPFFTPSPLSSLPICLFPCPAFAPYLPPLSCLPHHRLADDVANIMSPILFIQLLLSAINLAILFVALTSMNVLSLSFAATSSAMSNVLLSTFIFCMLSENITLDLYDIGDIFYECAWYRLSVKDQQLIIYPIQRSQKAFRLMGLSIIECSLRFFTSVKATFSN